MSKTVHSIRGAPTTKISTGFTVQFCSTPTPPATQHYLQGSPTPKGFEKTHPHFPGSTKGGSPQANYLNLSNSANKATSAFDSPPKSTASADVETPVSTAAHRQLLATSRYHVEIEQQATSVRLQVAARNAATLVFGGVSRHDQFISASMLVEAAWEYGKKQQQQALLLDHQQSSGNSSSSSGRSSTSSTKSSPTKRESKARKAARANGGGSTSSPTTGCPIVATDGRVVKQLLNDVYLLMHDRNIWADEATLEKEHTTGGQPLTAASHPYLFTMKEVTKLSLFSPKH